MTKTLTDLKTEAARHGAKVVDTSEGRFRSYQVEAPEGQIWIDNGSHSLLVAWRNGEPGSAEWRSDEIADAFERMASGTKEAE